MRERAGEFHRGGLVGRLDVEAEGAPGPHVRHPGEAQGGQRPLDGGTFGISDAQAKGDVDDEREVHDYAPYQSRKGRPVTRS